MAKTNYVSKRQLAWISVVLVAVIVAVALMPLTNMYTDWNKYCQFGHDYDENGVCIRCDAKEPVEEEEQDTEANGGGMVIGNDNVVGNGIMLLSTEIPVEAYSDYGISPAVESAVQLTATIEPQDAEVEPVDWTIEWLGGVNSWLNGQVVTDYVTVTPTSDGSLTANVEFLQPFGCVVMVRVALRDDPSIYAECSFNYAKRISSVILRGNNTTDILKLDTETSSQTISSNGLFYTSLSVEYDSGVGTKYDNFEFHIYLKFSSGVINGLKGLGYNPIVAANTRLEIIGKPQVGSFRFGEDMPLYCLNSSDYNAANGRTGWNAVSTMLKGLSGTLVTLEIEAIGTYSSATFTRSFSFSSALYKINITGFEINQSDYTF